MRARLALLTFTALGSYAMFACAEKLGPTTTATKKAPTAQGTKGEGVPDFYIRPGFHVDLVASIPGARFLEIDDRGDLFCSEPNRGLIATFREKNGKWERVGNFIEGHPGAHGMQWVDGWLWFTTATGVFKARDTNGYGVADETKDILPEGTLPGGGHWWKSLLVTKDGFYTSIGGVGNIDDARATDRQKMWHYNLDGSGKKLFASGIRNTEKLQYRPGTTEIYGWDQGSDNYGQILGEKTGQYQPITDEGPPEEFNKYVDGGFYGHPFILGNRIPRLDWMNKPGVDLVDLASKTIIPAFCGGPHWAADGWTFLNHTGLGEDFKGDALVAFHGSWNRVKKAGYRVSRILFDKVTGDPMGMQMLVGTLTDDGRVLGRPVDCVEMPDGSVMFSDDQGGKIYRLSLAK
jgi:glucose/arabinose dehydrogenase